MNKLSRTPNLASVTNDKAGQAQYARRIITIEGCNK
jgi:hypothetical protein